jgi:hypothetical protein
VTGPSEALPAHLAPLGDSGAFAVWRTIALRGAGVPFDALRRLADDGLAAALDADADAGTGAQARYEEALAATSAELVELACDERFLQAVVWQNPQLVRSWLLDFLRGGAPAARNKRYRQREAVLLSYLQRYGAKNDTIGFFGPVGWARFEPSRGPAVRARYGDGFLDRQTVHFETWAIDQLAVSFSRREDLRPLVPYRRVPAVGWRDATAWRGTGTSVELTSLEAFLLGSVDGRRTAAELVKEALWTGEGLAGAPEDVTAALAALERRSLVRRDLRVPLSDRPEEALATALDSLRAPGAARARADLGGLVALRDEVARATGAEELLTSIEAVHGRLSELTGAGAERLAGRHFVGRTPLYTDACRAADVTVADTVLEEIAAPLEGLLTAARWFGTRIGELVTATARDCLEQLRGRVPARDAAFPELLSALNPIILGDTSGIIAQAQGELVGRFADVITGAEPDPGVVRVDPTDFLDRCRDVFASPPPAWAVAHYHSPDLMIDAADTEAIERGAFRVVVGELHAGMNTLQSRVFSNQSPDPEALQRCAEADPVPSRVVPLFPKGWPRVTSRTYPPPVLVHERAEYVAVGGDLGCDDVPARAAGDLVVTYGGDDGLIVAARDGSWARPLLEVIGEFLSMATAVRFRVLADAPRSPRVEIGKLVAARRTWRFPDVPRFARAATGAARFAGARAWMREHDLTGHVFVRLPGEPKPWYVDFASPLLVENLVRLLRRAGDAPEEWAMTVTEMLPAPSGLWLSDAAGRRYTSELRLVAVDLSGRPAGAGAGGRAP